MNGTHQVLANADDVNFKGDDFRTVERNADLLLNASKDIIASCTIWLWNVSLILREERRQARDI